MQDYQTACICMMAQAAQASHSCAAISSIAL